MIEIKSKDSGETILSVDADTLTHADFRSMNLRDADLSNTDLRHADFSLANLTGADLSNSQLQFAEFSGAKMSEVNLLGSDLSRSVFSSGRASGAASLNNANLSQTIMLAAELDFVNLQISRMLI
ncbi:MAG: pentapeptide repeat-containing protein [gamma proteobacterium symbiont of Lucinoma myriamae]|nr:pentapeptide repeat-containing protein [gamma proteobacterium symbiont of Lucinoma myriamae]MCU7832836.1 pentapeptide repeat-containing protein [gamma proteobacterium symbiont of Lucinoma myriamae]